ncbi:MAG: zinc-dependent metalloprotease [Butyricimonas faecihominis]
MRLDPSSFEEDLGDDPVKAGYGVKNLKYVLAHLNEWVGDTDKDYTFRQEIYNEIVYQYVRYLNHVTFNIGGVYLNERYDGDARPSYQVVPREKQERALQFLLEQVKDLTWLSAKELRKTMPLMGDVTGFLEDEIFKILTNRLNAVAINVQQSQKRSR